jgi:excisionase family DNA binding protein
MSQIILTSLSLEQLKELFLEVLKDNVFSMLKSSTSKVKQESKNEQIDYLTRQEVAKLLQISLPTLHEYTKRSILTSYRVGSKVRYKASEIDAALKERSYSFNKKGVNHGA